MNFSKELKEHAEKKNLNKIKKLGQKIYDTAIVSGSTDVAAITHNPPIIKQPSTVYYQKLIRK